MGTIRFSQLAKELKIKNKDLLDIARELNLNLTSNSYVDEADANLIREYVQNKNEGTQPKLKKKVRKKKKKVEQPEETVISENAEDIESTGNVEPEEKKEVKEEDSEKKEEPQKEKEEEKKVEETVTGASGKKSEETFESEAIKKDKDMIKSVQGELLTEIERLESALTFYNQLDNLNKQIKILNKELNNSKTKL